MSKRILITEDEEHISKLVEFKLKKEGFETTAVANGKEALDKLAEADFDLLILDVMMPVMDGWETLRRLRKIEKLRQMPVLMLTAKGNQKEVANAAELGASQFLLKPFDPSELARVVKRMLGLEGGQ